ncbi:hypothetical protein ACWEQ7_15590 [Streptomyces sp. NPDC004069]|uniref:hypothetical protein n=1 Tax=Streptomyces sp. NPDC052043 TaxID=3365684 RepID=UPI0037D865A9
MSHGGGRFWNEETQRWEDATARPARAATPPPPARPDHAPPAPSAVPPPPAEFAGPPAVPGPDAGWQPPTVLGPSVPQRRNPERALWWKVAAGAAVVGIVVAFGVLKLTGGDGSDAARTEASPPPTAGVPGADRSPATGSAAPDESSPDDTATATSAPTVPPDGYHVVDDPAGFTIAVPDGWQRSERPNGIFYATDDDHRLLQVFVITEAGMTPYEAVLASSENLAGQPAYEEISVDQVGAPAGASSAVGDDAARLVYAYDSDKLGERRQAVEYAFTADDGKKYAVLAACPATDWPAAQQDADTVLSTFATR